MEIIRKYEPWLAYWVSEPDNGQSEAINKGFARATGDVLAWLCSDDTYRPGALGAVARYLHDHPHVGLVYGDCMMIDEESRPLKPAPRPSEFDPERMFADLDFLTQPAAFFRQEAYRAAGGLDPALHYHMDPDLWYRIGHLYRVERIPQVLANARIYPGTKTVSGGEGRWQELFALIRKYGDGTISRYQRAHYHLSTGRDAYKAGDDGRARAHLTRALWLHPPFLRRGWILDMYLKALVDHVS